MNIAKFAVRKPVTILMIVLIVLLLGGVSFSKLAVDLMPDIELPMVAVITQYEGAGPEEVEKTVSKMYESQLATIGGIDTISSQSSAGQSIILMMFDFGTNLDEAVNSCRDKLGFVQDFMPDKVGNSTIIKMDMNSMPIVMLTVSGDRHLDDVRKIVDDTIAPRLERASGIAAVTVVGGNTPQMGIDVDPLKLQAYGVTIDTISGILRSENNNNTGGNVVEGNRDTLVRIVGEYQSVADIADTHIPLATGGSVRLGDLATIGETATKVGSYATLDGKSVISIAIQKESGGNTVQVDKAVSKIIAELEGELYEDIQINYAFNQADFINVAINSVVKTAIMSAILAILVIFIFLRNFRSTMVIGTAIPLSVIGTFVLLFFDHQTLNMLTLGGLALGIGMTVDNAIVVLENIYRHRTMGKDKVTAAIEGAQEVTAPVIASTLTTVAVFFPIIFVKGIASEILAPLALTIGFALLASLVVSLTFVPMLSSKILALGSSGKEYKGIRKKMQGFNQSFSNGFDKIDNGYAKIINWSLNHKKTILFLMMVALIGSFTLVPLVGTDFIPSYDSGQINVSLSLPNGTVIEETGAVTARVANIVNQIPEVESVFTSVGGSGIMMGSASAANMSVALTPSSQRDRPISQISKDIEARLANIAGVEVTVSSDDMIMGGSNPISVGVKGQNMDTLKELAGNIEQMMVDIEGIDKVTNSFDKANEELNIRIDRERAAFYNVNSAQVYSTIYVALQGQTISTYKGDGEEMDIRIGYPDGYADSIEKIRQLMVPSNSGGYVAIEEIATIDYGFGQQTITRENQSRVGSISASIHGRDLGSITKDVQKALDEMPIPSGYEIAFGGTSQEMKDSFTDLGLALVMAILLVYMIMAAQFEGLLHPFIIMFSLPPTFIGVLGGLLLFGQTLNVLSLIGVIMLAGIVVNNAIVLVDYINTLHRDYGMEKREAIVEAGRTRLRPILMTTLTTIMGMLPQLLSNAEGAELMAPIASAIIGGLGFSTIITLILVPIMYHILDNLSTKVKKRWSKPEYSLEEGK